MRTTKSTAKVFQVVNVVGTRPRLFLVDVVDGSNDRRLRDVMAEQAWVVAPFAASVSALPVPPPAQLPSTSSNQPVYASS